MSPSAQFEDKVRSSVASRTDDKDIQGFLVGHLNFWLKAGAGRDQETASLLTVSWVLRFDGSCGAGVVTAG
jgi:hypothetical protein